MTEKEKYLQMRKEAAGTGITLLILIVVWYLAGFGMAQLDWQIAGLPIWTITGTVGVWIFALVAVKVLTTLVFKDFSLESKEGTKYDR